MFGLDGEIASTFGFLSPTVKAISLCNNLLAVAVKYRMCTRGSGLLPSFHSILLENCLSYFEQNMPTLVYNTFNYHFLTVSFIINYSACKFFAYTLSIISANFCSNNNCKNTILNFPITHSAHDIFAMLVSTDVSRRNPLFNEPEIPSNTLRL